jgi:uncharacterized protein
MTVKTCSILIVILAFMLGSCAPAPAQELHQQIEIIEAEERSITVSGTGEVMVAPDIAILLIGIESIDKDVIVASDENDEIATKVVGVLRHYNIDESDILTDYINTYPEMNGDLDTILKYYVVRKIKVTIRDLSQLEDIKANVLIAGANREYGVYFQVTDLQQYRDQARALAIQAARAEAETLALQLEQEVGDPTSIQETQEAQPHVFGFGSATFSIGYINAYSFENALSFGKIPIESTVTVKFRLE